MIRKSMLALVTLGTLVGCSTLPATSVTTPTTSPRVALSVNAKVQAPSLAVLKQLLPRKISASAAKNLFIFPKRDQVRVPQSHNRKTSWLGGYGWGGGFGLYPFNYLGSNWYAPYYSLGSSWYPFAFAPFSLGLDSYLAYPFAYGLGCYSPYIYGLGAYGFPYGMLGYYPYSWPYSYGFSGWGWPGWNW